MIDSHKSKEILHRSNGILLELLPEPKQFVFSILIILKNKLPISSNNTVHLCLEDFLMSAIDLLQLIHRRNL
jgi:hypothetical protein